MGTVSIVRTHGNDIAKRLPEALNLIGGLHRFVDRGQSVLLKPNLNGAECCTSVAFTEALIQLLYDHGITDIRIAEATFGNAAITRKYFRETGYYELAASYGIPLINLNEAEAIALSVSDPLLLPSVRIASEVRLVDKIINLPVMKVHYATGISLALKNLKGLLVGDEKKHFHDVGLDKAIVDLNSAVTTQLTIVDGTKAMETLGPHGGDVFDLNLLLAGANAAEVDYIGAVIMGFSPLEINHLALFLDRHGIDPKTITAVGLPLDQAIRPFKRVSIDAILPPTITVKSANACSSCMNALLISVRVLGAELHMPITVYIGDVVPTGDSSSHTIAFGNCCRCKGTTAAIKGCPPYPFELKRVVEGWSGDHLA